MTKAAVHASCSAVFVLSVWLFLWLLYPQVLNYHEQYQLFLFTDSYFLERIAVAGGLADYLSEFIVQFYYIKWLGALLLAGCLLIFQILTWKAGCAISKNGSEGCWCLSFVPALLLLVYMGNPDVLLSYLVALVIGELACIAHNKLPGHLKRISFLLAVPLLYWLAGPLPLYLFVLYAVYGDFIRNGFSIGRIIFSAAVAAYAFLAIFFFYRLFLDQYPAANVFLGINYYRMPALMPALQLVIPGVCFLSVLLTGLLPAFKLDGVVTLTLFAVAYPCTLVTYVKDNMEQLAYDYHIRNEQWDKVLERAGKYQPQTEFSASAVNLSLFMTGQMEKERMADFYQCGTEGLLVPRYRDLLTDMPTTEAYWRIGFINSTFRFMFDMQEASGNNRKSGRCTKRMVEALIVNGWYEVAEKYIDRLESSLFYRKWAKNARTYLWNDKKVNSDPVYAYLRAVRFEDDFLFNYPEMDKMLGKLYLHNKNNIMAAYYYRAYCWLKEGEVE